MISVWFSLNNPLISFVMTTKKLALFLVFGLLVLDWGSKWIFYSQGIGSDLPFLQPLLNTGISRWIPMPSLISCVIAIVCSLLFFFLFAKDWLTLREFSLFFAGTLGNLLDRIFLGGVRDFFAFFSFPVFNFADVFLTTAVILVCIRDIFSWHQKKKI